MGWGSKAPPATLFDAFQRHAARPFVMGSLAVRSLELPSLDEDTLVRVTRILAAQGVKADRADRAAGRSCIAAEHGGAPAAGQ